MDINRRNFLSTAVTTLLPASVFGVTDLTALTQENMHQLDSSVSFVYQHDIEKAAGIFNQKFSDVSRNHLPLSSNPEVLIYQQLASLWQKQSEYVIGICGLENFFCLSQKVRDYGQHIIFEEALPKERFSLSSDAVLWASLPRQTAQLDNRNQRPINRKSI